MSRRYLVLTGQRNPTTNWKNANPPHWSINMIKPVDQDEVSDKDFTFEKSGDSDLFGLRQIGVVQVNWYLPLERDNGLVDSGNTQNPMLIFVRQFSFLLQKQQDRCVPLKSSRTTVSKI